MHPAVGGACRAASGFAPGAAGSSSIGGNSARQLCTPGGREAAGMIATQFDPGPAPGTSSWGGTATSPSTTGRTLSPGQVKGWKSFVVFVFVFVFVFVES